MPKQRYKFVVLTNAVEGHEAEFNDWYSNTHLADVVAIPGFVSADRFELAEFQRTLPQLAIYEIETDDLKWVTEELGRRSGTPAMVISDAMHKDKLAAIFKPT
jgi:hypothetical protein